MLLTFALKCWLLSVLRYETTFYIEKFSKLNSKLILATRFNLLNNTYFKITIGVSERQKILESQLALEKSF